MCGLASAQWIAYESVKYGAIVLTHTADVTYLIKKKQPAIKKRDDYESSRLFGSILN